MERRLPPSFQWILIKFDLRLHIDAIDDARDIETKHRTAHFQNVFPSERITRLINYIWPVIFVRSGVGTREGLPTKPGQASKFDFVITRRISTTVGNHLRNGYCSLKCYEIARGVVIRTHARTRWRMLERGRRARGGGGEGWWSGRGGGTKTRGDRTVIPFSIRTKEVRPSIRGVGWLIFTWGYLWHTIIRH